jgi:glyoxylase-like metal-dependent hydrolase (beta-lactamase superfamily II)
MQVATFTFNEFSENTYVLFDETKQCAIIDPGCHSASEQNELANFITQNNLIPTLLLNTHCHIDHVLGNAFVAKKYNLPLHLHQKELETYKDTDRWAKMFGMVVEEIPEPQVYINEGQNLNFGKTNLQILLTPGHSVASLSFYEPQTKQLISGDVLFYQSIGRTDLPGGNFETLITSIKTKLLVLPDETRVYSGHGPKTSIGFEKANNPFLSAN